MIAFANHALDPLLGNVVDAGITDKVARFGSRYANDVWSSDFTICATKYIPELCHMHAWSSVVPPHSLTVQAQDRCSPSLHPLLYSRSGYGECSPLRTRSLGSASLCEPLTSADRKGQTEPQAEERVTEVLKSKVSEGTLICKLKLKALPTGFRL